VPGLVSANAMLQSSSVDLLPNWDGVASFEPAWAGYEFDLTGYSGPAEITNGYEVMSEDDKPVYLGLANWELNRWQWFLSTTGQAAALPDLAPFIRASDQHAVAVLLVLGTEGGNLHWLRFGGNFAPQAGLKADVVAGPAPLTVNFDTNDSYDLDGSYSASISVAGGAFVNVGSFYSYTYTATGSYQATLRVVDGGGLESEHSITINVAGYRPQAVLTADKYIGQPGLTVNFDAAGSSDQDGGITSYSWDFDGDGSDDSGGPLATTANYQYMAVGTYHPRLTVTDNSGFTSSEYVTVVVGMPIHETEPNDDNFSADELPTVPFANFLGDVGPTAPSGAGYEDCTFLRVIRPGLYTFNLQFIPMAGNLDIGLYGEDSQLIYFSSSSSFEEVFSYSLNPGKYYVRIANRVPGQDADYGLSISATFTELPVAALGALPAEGTYNQPIVLSGAGSYDPDGNVVKYEWDPYGDGRFEGDTGMSNQYSFAYTRQGTFQAALRVTDNLGAQDTATFTVTIGGGPALDEQEPNDDAATAQPVTLPLAGFRGDSGPGGLPGQSNYTDYYGFTLPGSGTFQATVHFDGATAGMGIALHRVNPDGTTTVIANNTGSGGTVTFSTMPNMAGDYVLRVGTLQGSSEYTLDVTMN
jgi:PKD repeat protein